MVAIVRLPVLFYLFSSVAANNKNKFQPVPFNHVIASLQVEPVETGAKRLNPNARVSFHALSKGLDENDGEAYILTNVVDSGEKFKGYPIYHATIVDRSTFQSRINADSRKKRRGSWWLHFFLPSKTLLCVHGFNTQPQDWFKSCSQYNLTDCETSTAVIPVIWPAGDKGLRSYMNDREEIAPQAARAFRPLLPIARSLSSCSIMCHSMGNYILRLVAIPPNDNPKPVFDHVFMVAADVRYDIFNSIRNKNKSQKHHNFGKNIAVMARKKVHVMHSNWDLALVIGRRLIVGLQPALGCTAGGVHPQKIHKDLRHKVINKNCNEFNKWSWSSNMFWHNYEFKREAVLYYETHMGGN